MAQDSSETSKNASETQKNAGKSGAETSSDATSTKAKENEETKDSKGKGTIKPRLEDGFTEESFTLFPERDGQKYERGFFNKYIMGSGIGNTERLMCEKRVYSVIEKSPLVKLLLSALKSSGCEFDINRHVCCESCSGMVTGGYDPYWNQIVICQNVAKTENKVQGALAHELVHMFDYCRAEMDLKNVEHLACTEIRAANLMHCSFVSAMMQNSASCFDIAKTHQKCVKDKAVSSILAVRDISLEEARQVVDKVFGKCYNDLEPVGRRIRRGSLDMDRAYRERFHYGYYY